MISPEYLAGLIDGEGYIALSCNRTAKEVINPSYSPLVKIGMTGEDSRLLFEEISEQYDCLLESYTRLTSTGRRAYYLRISGKNRVLKILNILLPHLRVKKAQALLVKEFCELPYEHPKSPRFDKNMAERRRVLYENIKALKRPDHLQRLIEWTGETPK